MKKPAPISFQWRTYDGRSRRVWRSDWNDDEAEILTFEEFNALIHVANRFDFRVIEAGNPKDET